MEGCIHHWIIAERYMGDEGKMHGVCKKCLEKKIFIIQDDISYTYNIGTRFNRDEREKISYAEQMVEE